MDRIDALDGLRGMAILFVFLFHVSVITLFDLHSPSLLAKLGASLGWMGVDLFFVLSGYLITRIVIESRGRAKFFRAFWIRRCLRILPPYFVFLVIVLILWPALVSPDRFSFDASRGSLPEFSYWMFVPNFFMAMAQDHGYKPLSITWSLAIELHFYIFWPLVVRWLKPRRLLWVLPSLLLLVFLGRIYWLGIGHNELTVYVLTPFRLDGLLAGALIACIAAEHKRFLSIPMLSAGCIVSLGLLLGGLMSGISVIYESPFLISFKYSLVSFLFFCLVCLVITSERAREVITAVGPLQAVGRYSYAIYLWHYFILLILAELLSPSGTLAWLAGNVWITFGLLFAAGACASFYVAKLSWLLIETRALSLKRLATYDATPSTS